MHSVVGDRQPAHPAALRRGALVRRLLCDRDLLLANRLARLAEVHEPDASLLALGREPGLIVAQIADVESLAACTRCAVCVLADGSWIFLELHRDGDCSVDVGSGAEPRRMRRSALAPWFPCQVLYAAPAPAELRPGVASSAGFAVYLRFSAQVLGLALPLAMMLVIDKVVNQGAENTLLVLVLGVTLLTAFQYLFLWAHARHTMRDTEAFAHPRRAACFGVVLRTPAADSVASSAWEVIQGAGEDARFVTDTRPQLLADVAFVALLGSCMVAFNPGLLVVTVAFVPLYVAAEAWGGRRALRHAESVSGLRAEASGCYFESIGAARLLHEMALTELFEQRWRRIDARLSAARFRMAVTRRAAALAVEGLQRLSVIVVMLLGVGAVIAGAMTLGQYVAFNLLSMQLAQPVLRLAAYRRAAADRRLRTAARAGVEARCRDAAWPNAGGRSLPHFGEVSVRVRELVIADGAAPVDFGVLGGQWLGVVGPSGCGKTTLLRCLGGTHVPATGEVRINGVPVRRIDPRERARCIRLVPQEPVMFTTSLAENIALGAPDATPQDVVAVARLCGLFELAAGWPAHLDTVVGAGGRPLSGGERQRVALARALLSRPQVLLLDEATAALDGAAEALLLERVRRFLPGAAVVVVAHRPTSLRGCGQIVHMVRPPADADARVAGDAAWPTAS